MTFLIFAGKYLFVLPILIALWLVMTEPKRQRRRIIFLGVVGSVIAGVISVLAAHFYYDPRPFVTGNFIPLIAHAPNNGFPSDHGLLVFSVVAWAYFFRKKWSFILLLIGLLVAYGRVYAGIHSWKDMIGSFVIAVFSFWLAKQLLRREWARENLT